MKLTPYEICLLLECPYEDDYDTNEDFWNLRYYNLVRYDPASEMWIQTIQGHRLMEAIQQTIEEKLS